MRSILILALLALAACGSSLPPAGPDATTPGPDAPSATADAGPPPGRRPIVILLIGDGMGPGQLEAASRFRHGEAGQLFLEQLPVQGRITTGNLSGTTDSAAAATTLATGVHTWNGRIGQDRDGNPAETVVELAHAHGLAAGIVTTASVPHATPAGFTAHRGSRGEYTLIAEDQALLVQPEVMLGGGARYFLPAGPGSVRTDDGLLAPLAADGYTYVTTAAELAAVDPSAPRVVGLFAAEHLEYVTRRPAATSEPTLTEMSLAALDLLDASAPAGFFLMIEGARIDMASHGNLLAEAVGETLAFDDAVAAVAAWAAASGEQDVTILITADHECGGLAVVTPRPAGELPEVSWRWFNHTNADVILAGSGPRAGSFHGARRSHRDIHAALVAALTGEPLVTPAPALVPDGYLADLDHLAATQLVATGFGAGYNQLDSLRLDADEHGLAIGVEGLFEWSKNAVIVLIDVDHGDGTGPARLLGAVSDTSGRIDEIVAGSSLGDPLIAGFGIDVIVGAWGGADPRVEDVLGNGGLRGLRAPFGSADDLGWFGIATNFGDGVRTLGAPAAPLVAVPDVGWEAHVSWERLYPGLGGTVPPGATIALAVVLVNDDGGYTSNQALPPFPAGTPNPGRVETALPALIGFTVDGDGDGVADGSLAPFVILP